MAEWRAWHLFWATAHLILSDQIQELTWGENSDAFAEACWEVSCVTRYENRFRGVSDLEER